MSLSGITRLRPVLPENRLEREPTRRLVWRPTDTAGWYAAPWWALTWLLTLGRHGRLPWTWEELTRGGPPDVPSPTPPPGPGGYRGPERPKPPTREQIPATPPRTGNTGTR